MQSDSCAYLMIRFKNNVFATQFHPEAYVKSIEVRINVYRHAGYFLPEDVQQLIAMCSAEDMQMPERSLRNIIDRYK